MAYVVVALSVVILSGSGLLVAIDCLLCMGSCDCEFEDEFGYRSVRHEKYKDRFRMMEIPFSMAMCWDGIHFDRKKRLPLKSFLDL